MPANDRKIKIEDVTIHYEYYPCTNTAERTIVLIHGFLSSTFSFRRLIPLLCETYTVYAVDLPGFGQSEKSKRFYYSLESYGKLIIRFLGEQRINTTILAGHSMGGQVALHAAKQKPQLVEKLILLCSSGYLPRPKRTLVYSSYLPFFTWWVRKLFEKRGVQSTLNTVVFNQSMIDFQMTDGYGKPFETKAFYDSLVRLLRHREGDLTESQLKSIDTPALLIWGKEDKVVPYKIGQRLVKDLPEAQLIAFEETGHLVPEERPDEVYRAMMQFTNE